MAVSAEVELRVLRQAVKNDMVEERISMLTTDAARMLGKKAQEFGIPVDDLTEIVRPIVVEMIEEIKKNFGIK